MRLYCIVVQYRENGGKNMTFKDIINYLNGVAWGPWMLILLVGTGIFLTWKLRFLLFV